MWKFVCRVNYLWPQVILTVLNNLNFWTPILLEKFLRWLNLQFNIVFLFFTVLDTAGQEVSLSRSLMALMLMHSLRVHYKNKLSFCSAWHFICESFWASFNLKSCFYLYFASLIYFSAGGGSHDWGAWIYQLWGYNSMYGLAVPECKPPGHTIKSTQPKAAVF